VTWWSRASHSGPGLLRPERNVRVRQLELSHDLFSRQEDEKRIWPDVAPLCAALTHCCEHQRCENRPGGVFHEVTENCWGCGNFAILDSLKLALTGLALEPGRVVIVSGIGQAAKLPHYLTSHFFNGLHGRALPVATAIRAANPTLTVIAESGDGEGTRDIMMEAVPHNGFALVDVLQPCVTFNRVNTYGWFKNNTRRLPGSHDCQDREAAFRLALETAPIPLGILFRETGRPTFEENLGIYQTDPRPLFERRLDIDRLRALLEQACTTA
jgi:pyruvate/2-oxoacid:ferredoxin oxidoreductase beta subunit